MFESTQKDINQFRLFKKNTKEPALEGTYILYWMQMYRRFEYNYALEYAVAWANHLKKPLLIYEGLKCTYPWASERFHSFILDGMEEHLKIAQKESLNYFAYAEPTPFAGKGLVETLMQSASVVISDEFPAFVIPSHHQKMARSAPCSYIAVDSNGIIPLGLSQKAPYSAFVFRRIMQRHFVEAYQHPPKKNPIVDLQNKSAVVLPKKLLKQWPAMDSSSFRRKPFLASLPISHQIKPVSISGTRQSALKKMQHFIETALLAYGEERNHPDANKSSGLSPFLHFGKLSAFEILHAVLERQPPSWSLASIAPKAHGSREGFFYGNPSIEAFLDELITWREVGYHFCHHTPNYDQYASLPDWARQTLETHQSDPREFTYSLTEFEEAKTHDPIWNAAQRQLVQEGFIQNYLRMLWGKKVLEWTPDPQTALTYLIELNNKYALDGRNPNSYSGIFWIFGRFDRAWGPERPIFGKIRYMSSENTRKKLEMASYLEKYSR